MANPKVIVTDLNARERDRFAKQMELLAKAAGDLAVALRSGDDSAAMTQLALVAISTTMLRELTEIFLGAQGIVIPDCIDPRSPDGGSL